MRGWSGLHAAMDLVIECQRDKESAALSAEFVLTKVKDGTSGVHTNPGETAFDVTPCSASSSATVLVKPASPCLADT